MNLTPPSISGFAARVPRMEAIKGDRKVLPTALILKLYGGPEKTCDAPTVNMTIHVMAVINTTDVQRTIGDAAIFRGPSNVLKKGTG